MTTAAILVTGGTGFLGHHLVPRLLNANRSVILCIRNDNTCPAEWRRHENVTIVKTGALETAPNIDAALAGASTVIHMAGLAHVDRPVRKDEVDPFEQANAKATGKLAAASVAAGVTKFIHLSSLFAVTDNHSSTIVDDHTDRLPSTAYGRSKRAAEKNLTASAGSHMLAVSLRPPLIIGADAKGNWASLQRLAATGLPLPFASIDNRRSMIAVETVVKAIFHLCDGTWGAEKSGNYCIADQGTLSLGQMISELRKGMGLPPRLFSFPGEMIRTAALLLGQQRRVSGMLGDLEVDASRFRETFAFDKAPALRQSVQESGLAYVQSRTRKQG